MEDAPRAPDDSMRTASDRVAQTESRISDHLSFAGGR